MINSTPKIDTEKNEINTITSNKLWNWLNIFYLTLWRLYQEGGREKQEEEQYFFKTISKVILVNK